jgi:TPR repeat protein
MNVKKMITGLVLLMLMSSGMVVAADFNKGLKAAQSGDFKTALAEWTPLAELGYASAQYNLGIMYDNGNGVLENDKTAVKWFTLAADQGDILAQKQLGDMYLRVGKRRTAAKWITKAAKQGDASSQLNLGAMYYIGDGVLTDYTKAYMWLNLAAYNGNQFGNKSKQEVAAQMGTAQIAKAQDMSSRCLNSGYTDC